MHENAKVQEGSNTRTISNIHSYRDYMHGRRTSGCIIMSVSACLHRPVSSYGEVYAYREQDEPGIVITQ